MATDTRIWADAGDDLVRVHGTPNGMAAHFVEEGDTSGEIGVGEDLDRLRLAGASH